MKKTILTGAGIICLSTIALVGCKKDDATVTSKKDMLVGTWNVTNAAYDANSNQVRDNNENTAVPDSVVFTETFNSNGTGKVYVKVGSEPADENPFTWELVNNDNELKVTADDDVHMVKIISLTANDFKALDYTDPEKYTWYDLKK